MTEETADIVIVGAGIMGLSIAHQVRRRDPDRRIVVLEKARNVGEGSTGASCAILRQRYSYPDAIKVARDGHNAYKNWRRFTGLDETRAQFHHTGTLWIMGEPAAEVERDHQMMSNLGIDVSILDADEVRRRFPSVSPCSQPLDLSFEHDHSCVDGDVFLYEEEGGYFDPVSACQDLHQALTGRGVEVRFNSTVVGVQAAAGRVSGVELADGSTVAAPVVVNAAGPWGPRLSQMAGLEVPWDIHPIRAQVIYRASVPALMPIPVIGDASAGIYMRPENRGQQILIGSIREEDEQEVVPDPDDFNQNIDRSFRDTKIYGLHHRIPDFPYTGEITGIAGLYTINADDVYPIVGPTPLEGFVVANGFSGHGFKEAPAVGSMIAQWLTGDTIDFDTDADMSFFAFDRRPHTPDQKTVLA